MTEASANSLNVTMDDINLKINNPNAPPSNVPTVAINLETNETDDKS